MIKYKTNRWVRDSDDLIKQVEVERETDVSIWVNNYWDTWEDARDFLMKQAEMKLADARRGLQVAQSEYENVKGLKAPA